MPIVIIGTGMAGYGLAKEIRKLDPEQPLRLITADGGQSYPKPMLSNALINGKRPTDIVTADAKSMAEKLSAEINPYTRVLSIDSTKQRVLTNQGEYPYSRLVLATGASPIRLPLKGTGAGEVLSVNNLDDYTVFRKKLANVDKVAIIGPGLIGCEFANDLSDAGKQISVIGPDPHPISTLLPEPAGRALQAGLEALGVQFHLGQVIEHIDKCDSGYQITLSSGDTLQVGLVLSAIGLRPDLTLAKQIGLKTNCGIVTDRLLETSTKGIYALGDCLEVEGLNLPFVMPLMNASRVLAKTLTGTPTLLRYPAMPVGIKTPAHPITVAAPRPNTEGKWEIEQDETGVRALFKSPTGQLLGFTLTGKKVAEKSALTKQLPALLGG